jgi:hypothetical protein
MYNCGLRTAAEPNQGQSRGMENKPPVRPLALGTSVGDQETEGCPKQSSVSADNLFIALD